MKPAKNSFYGYTYQKTIAFLLLSKMDAEREINRVEIEGEVEDNFDDLLISTDKHQYHCQIKDMENVDLSDLKVTEDAIQIKGKHHKLSENINILFFKSINIGNGAQILGMDAEKIGNTFVVSMSRVQAEDAIERIYGRNRARIPAIQSFFERNLDSRLSVIQRADLPAIEIFSTQLFEQTIDTGKYQLNLHNALLIEGKPGVGKSHLVEAIRAEFGNHILYRFWTSGNDKDLRNRLLFENFFLNICKDVFKNYLPWAEIDLFERLRTEGKTVIIDGFDHVENYAPQELDSYFSFFENLKKYSPIIVLARPMKRSLTWDKQTLQNWTKDQTHKVLNELYHIADYSIAQSIFGLSLGYPILVSFIAKHFKQFSTIPDLNTLQSLDDYYNQVTNDINVKKALGIFTISTSHFTRAELAKLLGSPLSGIVNDFISSYPYLFQSRLDRITLVHDSLNTYLRKQNISDAKLNADVHTAVFDSIMRGEKRYLSRVNSFDFASEERLHIARKYASMQVFETLVKDAIDFEAIRSFYNQIRESLTYLNPGALSLSNYYDLGLITNISNRDHLSGNIPFLYTYAKCVYAFGFEADDVTSSEHLFGMLCYLVEHDPSVLFSITSNSGFAVDKFYEDLKRDAYTEEAFFEQHQNPIKLSRPLKEMLTESSVHRLDILSFVLTNTYIHPTTTDELHPLRQIIKEFMENSENLAIKNLSEWFKSNDLEDRFSGTILHKAREIVHALGVKLASNDYQNVTLEMLIRKHYVEGSFDVWPMIHSFLRLALHEKRSIDFSNIGLFWPMYHNRKDYSAIDLPEALTVFENAGLISEDESIDLITFAQSMSEKGIRHILAEYVELHDTNIIAKIHNKKDLSELEISWFNLPEKYIDVFPEHLLTYATDRLLSLHSRSQTLNLSDMKGLPRAKIWNQMIILLRRYGFKVRLDTSFVDEATVMLIPNDLIIGKGNDGVPVSSSQSSSERYSKGIIDSSDADFIRQKSLSLIEVSRLMDGDYSIFADLEIYRLFPKQEVTANALAIFQAAIAAKVWHSNFFALPYYLVGNIPKFIVEYAASQQLTELYESFRIFLKV